MRLNRDDKEMLENMGFPESDFAQIENAIGKTKYTRRYNYGYAENA